MLSLNLYPGPAYRFLQAIIIACLVLIQGCSEEPADKKEVAPSFSLELFDGKSFKSSEYKGKPMLVNFFASWCLPCAEEAPVLERMSRVYGPQGIAFVAIAIDDTEEKAKGFIEKHGISFSSGIDKTGKTKDAFGVYGVPTTFFIGQDGLINYLHAGGLTEVLLIHELDKLLYR